jgi:hypothetical protein
MTLLLAADIVTATWGLVAVTTLLVVIAGLSLVRDLTERRARSKTEIAKLVPDLNVLKDRIGGTLTTLHDPGSLEVRYVWELEEGSQEDLELVNPLADLRSISLELVLELYLLRHFLTQAGLEVSFASLAFEDADQDAPARRIRHLTRARAMYEAASRTVDVAEGLLPKRASRVRGEVFSLRFERLQMERDPTFPRRETVPPNTR